MAHNNNLEIIPTASSLLNEINQLFDSSSSESQTDDDSEDGDQEFYALCLMAVSNYSDLNGGRRWEAIGNYTDCEFWHHFRVTRNTFERILDFVTLNSFVEADRSVRERLYITLKYLGTKGSVHVIAKYFSCKVSDILSAVAEICDALNQNQNQIIKWPEATKSVKNSEEFKNIADFPGVVGVIGETHIEIRSNRKIHKNLHNKFHSIIILGVVNTDKTFSYLFTGFPGSYTNMSYVLEQSNFYHQLEENCQQFFDPHQHHILAGDGFGLKTWMMVPFAQPATLAEKTFNYSIHLTRKVVDDAFYDVKKRFQRCQSINAPVARCVRIAVASCVIHNMCIANKDSCVDYFPRAVEYPHEVPHVSLSVQREPSLQAQEKRKHICHVVNRN